MYIDPMFAQGFFIDENSENPRNVVPIPLTRIKVQIPGAQIEFGVGAQFQKQHVVGSTTTVVVVGIFMVDQEIYPHAYSEFKSYFQQFYVLAYTTGTIEVIEGEQLCHQLIDDKPFGSWHPRNDINTEIMITKL